MKNQLELLHSQWEQRWLLANPLPKLSFRDKVGLGLQYTVIAGSTILSGSRTGLIVAQIGALTQLASKAHYFGLDRDFWVGVEALLGFATFEAGVLLVGYLEGDKDVEEKWFKILLIAAIVPAIAANMLPGWFQIETRLGWNVGQAAVDVIIGVLTPFMAYISGKVLGGLRTKHFRQLAEMEREYQTRKKSAWEQSPEYKQLKQQSVGETHEAQVSILDYLNGQPKTATLLAQESGLTKSQVISQALRFQKQGKVKRDGENIMRND